MVEEKNGREENNESKNSDKDNELYKETKVEEGDVEMIHLEGEEENSMEVIDL